MSNRASARTKALLRACLKHDSDEDNEDNDVIEGTPVSSPTKVKKALLVAGAKDHLSGKGSIYQPSEIHNNTDSDAKNEKPLLMPKPPEVPAVQNEYEDSNINIVEDIGERSIEPPPYSPLTPRPNTLANMLNTHVNEKSCLSLINNNQLSPKLIMLSDEINTEGNIKSQKCFFQSPKAHCSKNLNIEDNDSSSSPVRAMSPETTELFNILVESLDNDELDMRCNNNAASNLPLTSGTPELNSDDSIQDPDFVCLDKNIVSSDTSSENSVSLITTLAEVYPIHKEMLEETEINSTSTGKSIQEKDSVPETSFSGRPSRGRKRLYGGALREERKMRKYNNLSYVNSKKQNINPKQFIDYSCDCPRKCQEKISTQKKIDKFTKFYSLGSYIAQNMYLVSCVKEKAKKRAYISTAKKKPNAKQNNRTYSREYYLKDICVCQKMFLSTFQISSKRVNTALCKMRNNCVKDMRGQQAEHNAVSTESELFLVNVINKLPTYISHYRRAKLNETKFLTSDMTLPKIYDLYKEEAKLAGQTVLSYAKVRHLFVTKFNLRTKPLKKDTCNKCDMYKSKQNQASEEEKRKLQEEHQKHIDKAKILQDELKSNMQLAKEDPTIETITFDLQKTLPLPRIPTNVVFYKRQLWIYNLGIHTGSNEQAYCNVWMEGEAGRGSQEVGSCLIKHIGERLKDGVEHLILWSDSCGGQNRNIKLTLMLKAVLNDHPTLKKISHRFLESGHSFLPNDTDFGRIECALKHQQRLYTLDDYTEIMKKCKKHKPLIVQKLNKEDFLSSRNLEKKVTNRKKAEDGTKISWLDTKEIVLKKDKMYSIFMRKNLDEPFAEVNLKKNVRSAVSPLSKNDMHLLWPTGKPISEAKLADLRSIMHLIPKDAHDFYSNIKSSENVEDDIDGYTGAIDFDLENEGGEF